MTIMTLVAAGTSVKGYDMAVGQWWKKNGTFRRIRHVGLVGSTAIGDCFVSIEYGQTLVGVIGNSTAGANKIPNMNTGIVPHRSPICCAPHEEIFLILQTDVTTNQVVKIVDLEEWV